MNEMEMAQNYFRKGLRTAEEIFNEINRQHHKGLKQGFILGGLIGVSTGLFISVLMDGIAEMRKKKENAEDI